jgi:hypothetical protein
VTSFARESARMQVEMTESRFWVEATNSPSGFGGTKPPPLFSVSADSKELTGTRIGFSRKNHEKTELRVRLSTRTTQSRAEGLADSVGGADGPAAAFKRPENHRADVEVNVRIRGCGRSPYAELNALGNVFVNGAVAYGCVSRIALQVSG